MKKQWKVLTICLAVSWASLQALGQNQPLVIEGGTLIDGTGRSPVRESVVVTEGSRIRAVGIKGKVSYPPNARIIQAEGKTILPGLIDSHIHLRAWMPPLFLRFGVTTVYDTTNPTEWILAQREAVHRGRIKGPRMFVTGVTVDGPIELSNMNHSAERGGYRIHVRTPEEARSAVRELVRQGVDAIKVHEGLTPDLLRPLMDEVHKARLEAVGHSHNAREAALAGLKFIEHTEPIARATIGDPAMLKEIDEKGIQHPEYLMETERFDPLIRLLVNEGVYFNPTFYGHWRMANPRAKEWGDIVAKFAENPDLGFVPAERRQSWLRAAVASGGRMDPRKRKELAEGFRKVREFTRKFAEAGGKVVAGSDTGTIPGLGFHFEMQSLVDAGLTPLQAILGATKWAAELLHKEKDLGTIEVGKIADIVVVNGDPLADITATRNVHLVIQEGQIIDTALDPQFQNPLPRTVYADGPEIFPRGLTPRAAREGDPGLTLEVKGAKFNPRSVVRFDTTDLPTRFVSEGELTATVSRACCLERAGTYAITVANPGSGGGVSNVVYFLVNFRD